MLAICWALICVAFFGWLMLSGLSRGNLWSLLCLLPIAVIIKLLGVEGENQEFRKAQLAKCRAEAIGAKRRAEEATQANRETAEEIEQREREEKAEREEAKKKAAEETAKYKWKLYFEEKSLSDIHQMTGYEFERFIARLLKAMGYTDIHLTPATDQGGDIVCKSPEGVRTVVQAKRWKKTLGNRVVQEILGAMLYYDCQQGMIISSSYFSTPAEDLADRDSRISLHDIDWLEDEINEVLPTEIPEFDWSEYRELVAKNFIK